MLIAFRGPDGDLQCDIRGFPAGSYTDGLIAAWLEHTLVLIPVPGQEHALNQVVGTLQEARICALNFPPRIFHWIWQHPGAHRHRSAIEGLHAAIVEKGGLGPLLAHHQC